MLRGRNAYLNTRRNVCRARERNSTSFKGPRPRHQYTGRGRSGGLQFLPHRREGGGRGWKVWSGVVGTVLFSVSNALLSFSTTRHYTVRGTFSGFKLKRFSPRGTRGCSRVGLHR